MFRNLLLRSAVLVCLPWVVLWAWNQERRIKRGGRSLTEQEAERARRAGVRQPERVRVLNVERVPLPGWKWMHRLAARLGFDGSQTAGMTLRYGIFVRNDRIADPGLLLHECCHTGQFERMGSITAFMWQYLVECLRFGYANAPLEVEARAAVKQENEYSETNDGGSFES